MNKNVTCSNLNRCYLRNKKTTYYKTEDASFIHSSKMASRWSCLPLSWGQRYNSQHKKRPLSPVKAGKRAVFLMYVTKDSIRTALHAFRCYFSAGSMTFQMQAAKAPPTKGPTMKIQRLASAVPPWKMAGASERAGFTEVPV